MKNACDELRKAGTCLYLAVDEAVAKDMHSKILAVINQHDKLIELLKKIWDSVDDGQFGAQCPGCGRCVEHEPDCELTVLLTESWLREMC